MTITARQKLQRLERRLGELGSVAVSFSGGVDSTFLLAVGAKVLGERCVGVVGLSPTLPGRELREARALAARLGARLEEVETHEIDDEEFTSNPSWRCRVCKTHLFQAVKRLAAERGIAAVLEGSNADDTGDHRPGIGAARAEGVISPLMEAGLTKDEIRELSREMELPTWDKPAFACLSSRVPYGETIDLEKLARIERAEDALIELGYRGARVRDHGTVARVELDPAAIDGAAAADRRAEIVGRLKAAGYLFVCLDLEGYRTGSMNRVLAAGGANTGATQE